jgi:hypothetical protein
MLFRLEVRRSRDAEWNNLSDLNTPFIDALRLLTNDSTKAAAQLKRAILQVLESPDIAENDREPIARLLHKKYKEREAVLNLEAIPIPGEVEKLPTMAETLKDLGSANADTNPMSVNQLLEV